MKPVLLAARAAAAALPAAAGSYRAGALEAIDPWSRPAMAGMNGAGFMTLINHGKAPDALVRVESPAAERVEVHRSETTGGVMRMGKVERMPLAAGGRASFAPGSYHLMFIRLKKPLKAGDMVPATLVFASGERLKAQFAVGAGGGPPQGHAGHDGMH